MDAMQKRQVSARTLRQSLAKKNSETTDKGLERAREILDAARDIFASEGFAALSMRSVAARVGVSLSTVQHYYRSKEALLEALLVYTLESYQAAIDRITGEMAGASRLEQFAAAVDVLIDVIRAPLTRGVFVEIWALANRHAYAARIVKDMQNRERRTLYRLIRGLNEAISDKEYEQRAALIAAQLEGVMMRVALRGVHPAEAQRLAAAARQSFIRLATEP